jgi:hypothetical protein
MVNLQPEEFAETITWRPDQGEHPTTIDGRLTRVSAVEGAYGRYPLLELEPDDGPAWAIHVLHGVLKDELQDLAPQIGDRIQISYRGKTDSGRGYFSYRVRFVDGSSRQVDWSRFSDDPAGQEPLPVSGASAKIAPAAGQDDADSSAAREATSGPAADDDSDIPF